MPTPYAIAYAALIKGLFYCDECLEVLHASCENVTLEDIWRAKESLMENGYRGKAYGRNVDEICDEMFSLARRGLNAIAPHEKDYLEPLAKLVAARTTLADLS